jgi:hypothetical protein
MLAAVIFVQTVVAFALRLNVCTPFEYVYSEHIALPQLLD